MEAAFSNSEDNSGWCDYVSTLECNKGGFNFDNYRRNELILGKTTADGDFSKYPPFRKTGTTIVGLVCGKSGVVLGADTRATEGPIVADKNCLKLHRLTDNIYCAGAGVSADLTHNCDLMSSKLALHSLNISSDTRVCTAVSLFCNELFKYQGHKQCALIVGGVDIINGPQLYKIHPHGSSDHSAFASMGSGSLNALAVLEAGYKENMSIEEGKVLVSKAIQAGIYNDLGSGGKCDICVIANTYANVPPSQLQSTPKPKAEVIRSFSCSVERPYRMAKVVDFNKGTTTYLREKISQVKQLVHVVEGELPGHSSVSTDIVM